MATNVKTIKVRATRFISTGVICKRENLVFEAGKEYSIPEDVARELMGMLARVGNEFVPPIEIIEETAKKATSKE